MVTADQLQTLDDAALANLKANAARLQSGGGARRDAATALLPLIEAEIAERKSRKPARPASAGRAARTGRTSRATAD